MDFSLLGPMVVASGGELLPIGGLRQRSVLAALLLDVDRSVEIDQLIDDVWHDAPPAKPVASLRAYIANLRRILGDEVRLVTEAKGYRLHLGDHRLDTREFEALIVDGRRLLNGGDATGAGRVLARALTLWRGAPLSDFRDQPFTYHEVHRLEALRADAVETRFEAELRLGRNTELISSLEAEVTSSPMRERLWGQLMLALDRLADEIRTESADLDWQPSQSGAVRLSPKARRHDAIFGSSRELQRLRAALTAASDGRGAVAVMALHSQGGRRIFSPLYHALIADVEAAYGDSAAARASLRQAEQIVKATGERVWDTQLSARKLAVRADSLRNGSIRA